jgi:hypothetical protein
MTEEKAIALFKKWVKILRLSDWDILFYWRVNPAEMTQKESAGCASYNWICKQAVIEIADPEKYKMDMPGFPFDYEQILVHELMHLKMSLVDDPDDKMVGAVVHQLVEEMAKSLVKASRESAVSV